MMHLFHGRKPGRALALIACLGPLACGDSGEADTGSSTNPTAVDPSLTASAGPGSSSGEPVTGASSGEATTTTSASASDGTTRPDLTTGEATTSTGDATTGEPSQCTTFADPLIGGTTGTALGGSFGPDGWTVTAVADRVFWEVPRYIEGSVAFTMANVTHANLPLNDHEVFAMYEGGHGIEHPIDYNPGFRNNAFKSMIRIYGVAEGDRLGKQKVMWGMCPFGAPGYHDGTCPCTSPPGFFEEPFAGDPSWDGTPQRLKVAWGDGITRYYRNDVEVLAIDWSASGLSFGPDSLYVSLGNPRPEEVDTAGMPIGAVFSDLVVEGCTGPVSPQCSL